MSKILTFLLVVAIAVLLWIAFRDTAPKDTDVAQQPSTTTQQPTVDQPEVSQPEQQPSTTEEVVPEGLVQLLKLDEPVSDATVSSPFVVKGTVGASGKVHIRILNKNDKELISEFVNSLNDRSFKATISYEFANTREGFLEVSVDAEAPVESSNSVKIPLKFL